MRQLPMFLALVTTFAAGQGTDPLKSPECGQALSALQHARGMAPKDAQVARQVEPLRKEAARLCLGAADAAPSPSRVAPQPLRMPSPVTAPGPAAALAGVPPPIPPLARPAVVTTCDAGGCWDSNGIRLNRAGPNLIGPSGLCTVQGALLNCH